MNDTTFPPYEGRDQDRSQNYSNQGGYQNNYQRNNYQNNQSSGGYGGYKKNNYGNKGGYGGYNKGNFKKKEEDLTLYKPYAFIANDDMPQETLMKMSELFRRLETMGYTLRVDGMKGPSDWVENQVTDKTKLEVHLPWKGFENKESKFTWTTERARAVAKMFHPAFDNMKKGVQTFLAKNARLILGDKVNSPVLFLITWTEDGAESAKEKTHQTGFAGHPIAIASSLGVPIFNFSKDDAMDRVDRYLTAIDTTNYQD